MEVIKLVGIGIVISIVTILLKQVKPELSIFAIIIGSVILLLYILNYFTSIFSTFNSILEKTNIDSQLFSLVIKIIGVGYLVEFGASICNDSGNSSIAEKIILGGKIIIFSMAVPIITSLFEVIMSLLKWEKKF